MIYKVYQLYASFISDTIYIYNKLISTHKRLYNVNQWSVHPCHYLELIQQRPESFDSARPIKNWRKSWPEELEKLRERFCNKQTYTKGIKDFISVLMLYDKYEKQEVDTAVQKALNAGVSTSEGVKHILKYLNKDSLEAISPLRDWAPTIKADVTVYEELGGRV